MSKLSMTSVSAILLVLFMIMLVVPHAESGISCKKVVNSLQPCMTYLKRGGAIPGNCCSGVKSLNTAAKSSSDRRTACECIKVAARAYKVNPKYASVVPSKCRVNIGYPISYTTNCNNVH